MERRASYRRNFPQSSTRRRDKIVTFIRRGSQPASEADSTTNESLLTKALRMYRTRGFLYLVAYLRPTSRLPTKYYQRFHKDRTFLLEGRSYHYFYEQLSWGNERAVEVPIALDGMKGFPPDSILEVGNVLSRFFPVEHDVVDKYEKYHGVTNVDIVDFRPEKKYDVIVSISTLEHIGWEDSPEEPRKAKVAVERIRSLLSKDGTATITMPLGYNPSADKLLQEGLFDEQRFLKRVSKDNRWEERSFLEVMGSRYAYPFPFANAIVIGTLRSK